MSNPFTDKQRANKARSRAAANRYGAHKYLIEGEYVTMGEIAARLGVEHTTAKDRHAKLCELPGNITWEKLETVR